MLRQSMMAKPTSTELLFLLTVVIGFSAPIALAQTLPSPSQVQVAFDWSMKPRFGRDDNNNQLVDLPNTCQYVMNLPPQSACPPLPSVAHPLPVRPKFRVTFDASQSKTTAASSISYQWTIRDQNGAQVVKEVVSTPVWGYALVEGKYRVELAISSSTIQPSTNRIEREIVVKDYLIVSIGDSLSSGEGNPTQVYPTQDKGKPVQIVYWADDGIPQPGPAPSSVIDRRDGQPKAPYMERYASAEGIDHIRSHRSTIAWPAQVALALEKSDPRSSVTFISVAASGASILSGIVGPYYGVGNEPLTRWLQKDGKPPMNAQIDQVRNIVRGRKIDALLISIGANDTGFAQVVMALFLRPNGNISFEQINRTILDGKWTRMDALEPALLNFLQPDGWAASLTPWDPHQKPDPVGTIAYGGTNLPFYLLRQDKLGWEDTSGLAILPTLYDLMNREIHKQLQVDTIFIVPYPNPTQKWSASGPLNTCPEVLSQLGDIPGPDLEINSIELTWVVENFLTPLNRKIAEAAQRHGWVYAAYDKNPLWNFENGHGLCADSPYPHGKDYTLYPLQEVTPWPTSKTIRWFRQAEESSRLQGFGKKKTKGTLHPNEFGHQAIKEQVLFHLRPHFESQRPEGPNEIPQKLPRKLPKSPILREN